MAEKLPHFEQYGEGSQIRRSMKSVKSSIVEGYGRRMYKQDYIRFIVFALASNTETIDHLETLYETNSLKDTVLFEGLHKKLTQLGIKINNFLQVLYKSYEQPNSYVKNNNLQEPDSQYEN